MSAPKKVWMRVNMAPKRLMEEKLFDDDIQYIRADIVEEMREALEGLVKYVGRDHAGVGLADLHNKGIYALKRLEEE